MSRDFLNQLHACSLHPIITLLTRVTNCFSTLTDNFLNDISLLPVSANVGLILVITILLKSSDISSGEGPWPNYFVMGEPDRAMASIRTPIVFMLFNLVLSRYFVTLFIIAFY